MQTVQVKPAQFKPASAADNRFSSVSPAFIGSVDAVLSSVQKTRTREMLAEDVLGMGVLRTGMDLFRQYFYSTPSQQGQKELNLPAARERVIRELGSIFTDNILGGVLAYLLAMGANRFGQQKNCANMFASNETLTLFQGIVNKSSSQEAFLRDMAQRIALSKADKAEAIYQKLRAVIVSSSKTDVEDAAVSIAKMLDAKTLDITLNNQTFALDSIVEDASNFLRTFKPGKTGWQKWAKTLLENTTRVNAWRLPISLGLAMGATFAVPCMNNALTRKLDGIDSYPGELGLRKPHSAKASLNKTWFERYFPYLSETLKDANPLPMLLSLLPLPFAFGMVNTEKLSAGVIKGAFNNPLKTGFLKRWASMMQFGKGFPFTTPQQMASCFAFLIFSRLTTSRSAIEFRERLVDSFLGWGLWIFATPLIKRAIARKIDKNLLKQQGGQWVLKRRVEIERLLPSAVKQSTLGKFVLLSAGSLLATIGLLGILEPYLAIKWSERQVRKDKNPWSRQPEMPFYQPSCPIRYPGQMRGYM